MRERKSEREEGRGRARHEDHIVEASGDDLQELDHAPCRPAHPAGPRTRPDHMSARPHIPAPAGPHTPAPCAPRPQLDH